MVVCRKCGRQNAAGTTFCASCGAFLEWTGEAVDPDAQPSPRPPGPTPERPALPRAPQSAVIVADLDPNDLRIEPGAEVAARIRIRNTGHVVDELSLAVEGEPGAWADVEPRSLNLYPGTEGGATVTFRVPRAASATAGVHPFGLAVRSRVSPTSSVVLPGRLEVLGFDAVTVEMVPRRRRGYRGARYELRVSSEGNRPATVGLTAVDPDGELRLEIRPPTSTVAAGGSVAPSLRLRTPGVIWVGTPRERTFMVAATADAGGGPVRPVASVPGSFTQRAVVLPWHVGIGTALVAAGLAAAFLLGGWAGGPTGPTERPTATGVAFTAEPSTPRPPTPGPSTPGPSTPPPTESADPEPPVTAEVPMLMLMPRADATAWLSQLGLTAVVTEQEALDQQPGLVIGQTPEAGQMLEEGSSVTLTIALGPFCDGQRATMLAFPGSPVSGTGGDDVIVAVGDGGFEIDAGGGDDRVCLGSSYGAVHGGPGDDRILGSADDDVLMGDDGNDFIDGGPGNDWILGEDQTTETADRGNDELRGGKGNDILHGGRGNDTLSGGPGADTFLGDVGDDLLDDIEPDVDAMVRAGEGTDHCPGVGSERGPGFECETW
jgi:hypothetical protein